MGRKTWPRGFRKRWQIELDQRADELVWLQRDLRWQWRHPDEIEEQPAPRGAALSLSA